MKNLKLFVIGFALLGFIASCSKEGPTGPSGTDGTNGTDGNANVIVINHGADSLTNLRNVTIEMSDAVTPAELDSSLVLVYYQGAASQACNYWYPSPGLGCNHSYQTRWFYDPSGTDIIMSVRDADGSPYTGTIVRLDKVKVVIAKGTEFFSGKRAIDYSNYNEVKNYFNLAD